LPSASTCGQRPVGEQLARRGGQLVGLRAAHPPPERAVVAALDRDLHQRPQQRRVARGHQVHRPAHERQPHELALGQHAAELVRIEPAQARPQPEVGRQRRLRLEAEQVLHRRDHRAVCTLQEQLSLQQRAVELAGAEDGRRDQRMMRNAAVAREPAADAATRWRPGARRSAATCARTA
jgi:hypothetical protein